MIKRTIRAVAKPAILWAILVVTIVGCEQMRSERTTTPMATDTPSLVAAKKVLIRDASNTVRPYSGTTATAGVDVPSEGVNVVGGGTLPTSAAAEEASFDRGVAIASKTVSSFQRNRGEPHTDCLPGLLIEQWQQARFVQWTPDGTAILANLPDDQGHGVYLFQIDGSRVRKVARTSILMDDELFGPVTYGPMTYFDISPDGSRMVYSACRVNDKDVLDGRPADQDETDSMEPNYEIESIDLDGMKRSRLTNNVAFDNFPVWSLDGTTIAFIRRISSRGSARYGLNTMASDGTDQKSIAATAPSLIGVALHPPAWSPDGSRLAFVGYAQKSKKDLSAYVVNADGTGLTRISETLSVPSWSPDGTRLAFAKRDELGITLYMMTADGTQPQKAMSVLGEDVREVGNVFWSPDGAHILFGYNGICLVDVDDRVVSKETSSCSEEQLIYRHSRPVAWSPGGSRIAARSISDVMPTDFFLAVLAVDGSDVRTVTRGLPWLKGDSADIRDAEEAE